MSLHFSSVPQTEICTYMQTYRSSIFERVTSVKGYSVPLREKYTGCPENILRQVCGSCYSQLSRLDLATRACVGLHATALDIPYATAIAIKN